MARRLVVIVPVAQHIEPECERGLAALERRGVTVRRTGCHVAIDCGRSIMASQAIADGFDDLMWIDADVGFDEGHVEALRAHDEPFVCAIYPKRGLPELACCVVPGTPELVFGEQGGLVEILYAGMGFCLIRREVFDDVRTKEKLALCGKRQDTPFHPYFLPMIVPDGDGHWYLAEDYAFCERVRRAGHTILADTRLRLSHVGRYAYSWEDAMGERPRYANVKMLLR
jgi:hypothetical protein